MNTQSTSENSGELAFSPTAKQFLKEAAGWARFLSLLGLVVMAIQMVVVVSVLLFGAFSGLSMGPFEGSLIVFVYGVLALLYFFPLYYLFLFAGRARRALATGDSAALEKCFGYLRSHYKFLGVIVIALLTFYLLAIGAAAIGSFGSVF